MLRIGLVIALVTGLIAPAFAQRAEIEAVNAKWIRSTVSASITASEHAFAPSRQLA